MTTRVPAGDTYGGTPNHSDEPDHSDAPSRDDAGRARRGGDYAVLSREVKHAGLLAGVPATTG